MALKLVLLSSNAVEKLQKDKAKNLVGDLINELQEIDGVKFLAKKLNLDQARVKDLVFEMGNKIDDLFLLIATESNGRAFLTCFISKNLVEKKQLNAGQIVRELGKHIQGGGGGQPFYATAGGKNPEGIDEALKRVRGYVV